MYGKGNKKGRRYRQLVKAELKKLGITLLASLTASAVIIILTLSK